MAILSSSPWILSLLSTIMGYFYICYGAGGISASFIFGDSLHDAGNNNYIITFSKANFVPNGIDFPNHQPTGRFTNGRTTLDIIGQELGLPFAPPYLAPSTTGNAILNGVNYASGGGGILNETGKVFGGRLNLDAQLDNYANTRQDIISSLGMTATMSLLRKSLFSVVMGYNDFLDNYLTPILSIPERATVPPNVFIESMISKLRLQLTRLYYLDARKIVVTNIGPIGCMPYMRDTNPATGSDCVEYPNQLAQAYSKMLKDLIMELNSSLGDCLLLYADLYRIAEDLIQNHSVYGFEVADSACCYVAGRHGGLVSCSPLSLICPDRSKYFFWDPYHTSEAANLIIAKRLLDGDTNDIFPINIRQIVEA